MSQKALKSLPMLLCLILFAAFLGGCMKDGSDGDRGPAGKDVDPTTLTTIQDQIASLIKGVNPETCAICHRGVGDDHQEVYDELYQGGIDGGGIQISNVAYANDGVDDTVTFTMTKDGDDFDCTKADSLGIYYTEWDGTEFTRDLSLRDTRNNTPTTSYDGAGGCTVTQPQTDGFGDVSDNDGLIVVYGRDETATDMVVGHISPAKYPFAGIEELGTVDYESAANVSGCEKCHTVPFFKHAYIPGQVDVGGETTDFWSCKACHYDERTGGHTDWQRMVDDPLGWAKGTDLTAAQEAMYAYKANLKNDVHMSHAMEFPYPQSMSNCATCHEGKLDTLLTAANYKLETCKSCHPIDGRSDDAGATCDPVCDVDSYCSDSGTPTDTSDDACKSKTASGRAPALKSVWDSTHTTNHYDTDETIVCANCHKVGGGVGAPLFKEVHTGYNPLIYSVDTDLEPEAAGYVTRYSDAFTATVDDVSLTGNILDIKISATEDIAIEGLGVTDIVPTILVSFYGYGAKDFIVSNHTRDGNNLRMEKTIGTDNALFTEVATGVDGSWEVKLDLSAYDADPTIPEMIADGIIERAEIAFRPALKDANDETLGLNAPSKTFDISDNDFVDYYSPIVDVDKCNNCHDQLATTFHSGDRGGNVVVCRMCHVTTSGGSHLEMQSRSIDSYVHAIHSFQQFDPGDIDFNDPVEAALYAEDVEFIFPTFDSKNCEACHNEGTYNVPDQAKSLPGLLSGSDTFNKTRNIGDVPSYVTGPASRACGGCHRAQMINEDNASELTAFFQHTKANGYLVENDEGILDSVIQKIMGIFN